MNDHVTTVNASQDFGITLQNFIEHQSDQILVRHDKNDNLAYDDKGKGMDVNNEEAEMHQETCEYQEKEGKVPDKKTFIQAHIPNLMMWMKKYLGYNDLSVEIDFRGACVDLIATVPGNDRIPISEQLGKDLYQQYYDTEKIQPNSVHGVCEECIQKRHRKYRKPLNHSLSVREGGSRYQVMDKMEYRRKSFSGDIDTDRNEICAFTDYTNMMSEMGSGLLYGTERIRQCLVRNYHKLPSHFTLKASDEIILQPTSISGGMYQFHCLPSAVLSVLSQTSLTLTPTLILRYQCSPSAVLSILSQTSTRKA